MNTSSNATNQALQTQITAKPPIPFSPPRIQVHVILVQILYSKTWEKDGLYLGGHFLGDDPRRWPATVRGGGDDGWSWRRQFGSGFTKLREGNWRGGRGEATAASNCKMDHRSARNRRRRLLNYLEKNSKFQRFERRNSELVAALDSWQIGRARGCGGLPPDGAKTGSRADPPRARR